MTWGWDLDHQSCSRKGSGTYCIYNIMYNTYVCVAIFKAPIPCHQETKFARFLGLVKYESHGYIKGYRLVRMFARRFNRHLHAP